MDARDAFLGLMILFLVAWASFMQLQLTDVGNTVRQLGVQQARQKIVFSVTEQCEQKPGFELVPETELRGEEYLLTAHATDSQKTLCFYRNLDRNR